MSTILRPPKITKIMTRLKKIGDLKDVESVLQELTQKINEIESKLGSPENEALSDKDAVPGMIKILKNEDKSHGFKIMTEEGWKIPYAKDIPIAFESEKAEFNKEVKKSIGEIEADDIETGNSIANLTSFDEKSNKFIMPRPDYDSGWVQDASNNAAITIEHNLGITDFSNVSFYASFSADGLYAMNAAFGHNQTASSNHKGYWTQIIDENTIKIGTSAQGPPNFRCDALNNNETDFTHVRLKLWK